MKNDDFAGKSLKELIENGRIQAKAFAMLHTRLIDILADIESKGIPFRRLKPEMVVFTDDGGIELKDFAQEGGKPAIHHDIVRDYGEILQQSLAAIPTALPSLQRISKDCIDGGYGSIAEVAMALEKASNRKIYTAIIIIIAAMAAILLWLK